MFFTVFLKFLIYDGRSKFDSVLHTENDDDLYGFSDINMDCRCQDRPGLCKFGRGSDVKIDFKMSPMHRSTTTDIKCQLI